jgi:hydroxymethylglutaryl-CoA reductase (NADPH)
MSRADPVPRNKEDDYSPEQATQRREFVTSKTGARLDAVGSYTIDPQVTRGNIENFIGAVQMPLGLAGPLRIVGEHAQGDFYVPLATTEGTLVASYSRGMRVISECGGVRTTVVKHSMQRAPVFLFADALQAREFGEWLVSEFDAIKAAAEATTSSGRLVEIEQYPIANMLYTRFCYTTGDAAGQNMTGKATYVACEWIRAHHPLQPRYILSGATRTRSTRP